MADSERVEKVVDKAAEALKTANAVAAQLRRVTQWLEGMFQMDLDGDGVIGAQEAKKGAVKIATAVVAFVVLLAAGLGLAESIRHDMFTEGTYGTAYFSGDSSTLQGLLTVDDLTTEDDLVVGDDATITGDLTAGSIAGPVAATTISASGTVTMNAAINPDIVVVTDTNAYTVLANNSGQVHLVPGLTADSTWSMPAEAANLNYKFVYVGGAADAQDWIIDTGTNTAYFVGGVATLDVGGTNTACIYSDGNSNSKLTIYTPAAGTEVTLWCEDGTTWYVSGTIFSATDTAAAFADQ